MIDTAWAQAAAPGRDAVASPIIQMLPFVLIFVVFYFLLIRPQQQKQREHRAMLANLKRNDEVVTSGGLYGTVVNLTDAVVTVEIAPNVRVRIDRQQVASLAASAKKSGGENKERDKGK